MTSNLDDVLDAYAASDEGPSREALETWVQRYPEYEQELTAFTVDWLRLRHVAPPAPAGDEETLVLRGMSVVHQLLYTQRSAPRALADGAIAEDLPADRAVAVATASHEPTTARDLAGGLTTMPGSLFGAAADRGLSADALAAATGLTVTLLRALSNRAVLAASVPPTVVDAIGRALGYARSAIAEYLALPPTLTAKAAYKADRAPQAPAQRTFADLVQIDPELTDAEQTALLALCPTAA